MATSPNRALQLILTDAFEGLGLFILNAVQFYFYATLFGLAAHKSHLLIVWTFYYITLIGTSLYVSSATFGFLLGGNWGNGWLRRIASMAIAAAIFIASLWGEDAVIPLLSVLLSPT